MNFQMARHRASKQLIAVTHEKTDFSLFLALIEDSGFSAKDCEWCIYEFFPDFMVNGGVFMPGIDCSESINSAMENGSWESFPDIDFNSAMSAHEYEDIF